MNRKIIAFGTDLHVKSTMGLCPPNMLLDDGQAVKLSPFQIELWRGWDAAWFYARTFAGVDELIPILGGDLAELDAKERSSQLISRNPNTVLSYVSEALVPALQGAKRAFFIRGTEAHVGKSAWMDEHIAADCTIAVPYSKKVYSHWQLKLNVDGFRLFVSHHPPSMTNPVNAAKKIRDMYYSWGEEPPDLALFGHVHQVFDSGLTIKPRILTAPGFTGSNAFIKRIGIYDKPQIGIVLLEIINGKLHGEPQVYRIPIKNEKEIKL